MKLDAGHEFDSSETCIYCGIAADKVRGGSWNIAEQCPARAEKLSRPTVDRHARALQAAFARG